MLCRYNVAILQPDSYILQSCLKRAFKADIHLCPTCRMDFGCKLSAYCFQATKTASASQSFELEVLLSACVYLLTYFIAKRNVRGDSSCAQMKFGSSSFC